MRIIFTKQRKEQIKIDVKKEHMVRSFGESTLLYVVKQLKWGCLLIGLIPLAEIAPDLAEPGTGMKYKYFIKNNMNLCVKYYKSSAIFDIIHSDGR